MKPVVAMQVVVIVGLLSFWTTKVLLRAYWTPLRRIPGPCYAKFTHLWLKKNVMSGRRVHYIHAMHQLYGPVVRIAPNEIDIADPGLFKQVHKIGGGFTKDAWYQSFRTGTTQDVFSMIDVKDHAQRRKLLAPLWTNTAIHNNWEAAVSEKVRLAVAQIKKEAQSTGVVDIFKWWTFMTTDVISLLAFGESMGMLERGTKNKFIEDVELAGKVGGFCAEIPWARSLMALIPLKFVRDLLDVNDRVQAYGEAAMERAKTKSGKENVFSRLIAEGDRKDGLTRYEVAFEAAGFIVAGSGTTAVSLTYLVWAVLSHPDVQTQLEAEVARLPQGFDDSQLEELPYLNAVIDETLRLYGAAPGNLPRNPPKGGTVIGAYFIPEGTTVSSQAFTLHRDPVVYPEPERFEPSRWIDEQGTNIAAVTAYAPFGAGSRTCIGLHLAKMELRHGAAEFFKECRGARIAPTMKPDDMDMLNFFLISPRSGRCEIALNAPIR
ncbi:hypothetical protein PV08_09996 [Exophiala spinifera]|uniref:Cytochrome P450 monooxygenase n=1 Tax=Exophiala spinifera TaxID=91928 RepID=A0A0D2B1B6_9EURO|nr:uncharacterized protein PV08_09996 [Exophiala spinifera]KIW12718.1 hypothetical protein PV08_09996 [Exophiala spinifera]